MKNNGEVIWEIFDSNGSIWATWSDFFPEVPEDLVWGCLFCGSDQIELIDESEGDTPMYQVGCADCGVRGPFSKSEGDAIKNWNRNYEMFCEDEDEDEVFFRLDSSDEEDFDGI